jgi:hypothetical protein
MTNKDNLTPFQQELMNTAYALAYETSVATLDRLVRLEERKKVESKLLSLIKRAVDKDQPINITSGSVTVIFGSVKVTFDLNKLPRRLPHINSLEEGEIDE